MKIVVGRAGPALIVSVCYAASIVVAPATFEILAERTGQQDGRVAQVSWLWTAAMVALWIIALYQILRRRSQ